MVIRSATSADAPVLSKLVLSLSHFYMESAETPLPEWLRETLTESAFLQRLADPAFLHLVATVDEQVVGYLSVKREGHLYHCFVDAEHQGKGYSRILWENALAECNVQAWQVRSSIYAVPVYQQFGFQPEGEPQEKGGLAFQPMSLNLA